MTISTHGGGHDWGSDAIVPTLLAIRDLGANWVAIHPYASINADGSLRWSPIAPENPPAHIARPIREAHRLGLSICIKPHIAYWRSPFSWRGEITFEDDEECQRFWRGYKQWITQVAAVGSEADGFVVGTELDLTLQYEEEWRDIIVAVRQHTDAPLTYAANWTDYQRVPFWDALDVIGIQCLFPDHRQPGLRQRGYSRRLDRPHARARRILRATQSPDSLYRIGLQPVVSSPHRALGHKVDGEEARPIQAYCMRTALAAIAAEPRVVGALLWKWFPRPRPVGRNFQLATPPIIQIISEAWLSPR